MRLWNYIKEKMLLHPDSIVKEGNASITYEELCIFAELFSNRLTEPYYAIACKSELAAAMGLLSCIAGGKTAIPIPTRYGEELYKKYIDKARPKHIITDFTGEFEICEINSKPKQITRDAAVVLFTSGSTGSPKGVMLTEENIISNVKSISAYFPLDANDTYLISRPLYHSSVLTGEFLLSLCKGSNIIFSSVEFSPVSIIKLLKENRVTAFGSTPTLMSTLAKFVRKPEELCVKTVSISGECMTVGMAKTIRRAFPSASIICGYGLSEASPRVAYLPPDLFDKKPCATGVPVEGVKIKILGENGKKVSQGTTGELYVRGKNVMLGYLFDKRKTAMVLKNGWLKTGDRAYMDAEGLINVVGRTDDMIIKAGMNIYPAEIENILSEDERVDRILVYGYSVNDTQYIGMKVQGDFSSVSQLIELCKKKLPTYQIPTRIEIVEKLNEGLTGKTKRKAM